MRKSLIHLGENEIGSTLLALVKRLVLLPVSKHRD